MIDKIKNNKNLLIFFFIISYFSLVLGFFLNEDLNGGARIDWNTYSKIAEKFSANFIDNLLNYTNLFKGERHSPIIFVYLTILKKLNLSDYWIRFINMHILLLCIPLFYQCLKIKFKNYNKHILFFISLSFFYSTTFRSLSIWTDSRLFGFLIFLIALKFFLKFEKFKKIKYCYYNIFFLALSSYLSPNFAVFSIYFFFKYYNFYKLKIQISKIIILNLFLAIPAIYYIFILKNFFFLYGTTPGSSNFENLNSPEFNFFNKFLIISTIIFFYQIPFLIFEKKEKFKKNFINCFVIIVILFIFCLSIINFDYQVLYTGGGIFFLFSQTFFKNNLFFFLIALISIYFVYIRNIKIDNYIIFLLLIISNIQLTIYHKYFDPLCVVLFLTLLNTNLKREFFSWKGISLIYLTNFALISSKLIKNLL